VGNRKRGGVSLIKIREIGQNTAADRDASFFEVPTIGLFDYWSRQPLKEIVP
jgi:hypothetical protein